MAASSSQGDVTRDLLGAAFYGNLKLLKRLILELDHGDGAAITVAKINHGGRTALHYAAGGGQFHICKYLIDELKLDVNMKDEEGYAPLHEVATFNEHLHTATYLLEKGANPSAPNEQGLTALHLAAEKGYKRLLRLLISKGAVLDAEAESGTPLHCASALGKKEAVKILLQNNANPNKIVPFCLSPLMISILQRSLECVKLLLEAGVDPNAELYGVTPLQVAAFEGETEITKCLIKAGANPNVVNNDGFTPIEIAALHGNHENVTILFPVTSRIPTISDWSYDGIVKYVNEVRKQWKLEHKDYFSYSKSKGDEAFKRVDCINAIFWYSEALYTDPTQKFLLFHRSLCWVVLKKENRAFSDFKGCLALSPSPEEKELRADFEDNELEAGFRKTARATLVAMRRER